MKLRQSKIIIFSLFIALINLLAVGCFFVSQGLAGSHRHTADHNLATMNDCSLSDYHQSDHLGYGLQYNLADTDYLPLNLGLFLFLILPIFLLKEINFLNYYTIKDRYGGFKLFCKFIFLFKSGILHPKIY